MDELLTPASASSYSAVYQLIAWKRYKEALAETETLLRDDPHNPYPYALYGQIHLLLSDYERAEHWATEALKRDPEHELGWYVRVSVYYETDNEKAFYQALQEAQRIDPYEAHYYFLEANRLNKKGKFKEAKERMGAALELDSENPQYLAMLSYIEALLGEDNESRRLDREAIRYGTEEPSVLLYLAWAAFRRGDYKLQETYMRSAVQFNPDSKQYQDEYLEALRHRYVFYRICLWPNKLLRRMKPWQLIVTWVLSWMLFKPLVIIFLILHVLAHWSTRAIIHVRIFGWRRRRR
ncbi:tetratricopeptide repeat protein [Paenibacillus albus]|uniref:Tetratricopeptide repeat protein n=1 Tax=Paenibacillus albus TaxID=2495582 RepID=A0A3S9A6I3_9BACL|nr:tetratricopeptide repeat protein [Paenibacillus albus]AZN41311.1 tetratricopeptide repeat protein [Paenibacillus albus]